VSKNPHAVALGKKAQGVPKRISPERAAQLRTQLIKARAAAAKAQGRSPANDQTLPTEGAAQDL
jgi:hypothetical protein